MIFVFVCPRCKGKVESDTRAAPMCEKCNPFLVRMLRDYRTESVNVDRSSLR